MLITCDLDLLRKEGYNPITPVLVTNADDYAAVKVMADGEIKTGEPLLRAE